MAQNPPNQGGNPQDSGPNRQDRDQAREMLDLLKQRLRLQESQRDILKESIDDMNKSIRAMERINAKIETMNRGTINIRDINREIISLNEKQYISNKKIQDIQDRLGDDYEESLKSAEKYNRLAAKKLQLEDEVRKKNSAMKKTQDELLKIGADAEQKARQHAEYLKDTRNIQHQLNQAIKANDFQKIANLTVELDLSKQLLEMDRQSIGLDIASYAKNMDKLAILEEQVALTEMSLNAQASSMDNQELTLAAQLKNRELLSKEIKQQREKLELEKNVSRNLGLSGKLMKTFADKLGIGNEVYHAMTDAARKNAEATDKNAKKVSVLGAGFKAAKQELKLMWQGMSTFEKVVVLAVVSGKALSAIFNKIGEKIGDLGQSMKSLNNESKNVVTDLTSGLAKFASGIPVIGGLLSGVITGFSGLIDLVVGLDDRVIRFARTLGMSSKEAAILNKHYGELSLKSGNLYMNSRKYLETQMQLSNILGVNNILSDQSLETARKLNDYAGIEMETSAELEKSAKITGSSMEKTAKGIIAQVIGLKSATGIGFNYQKVLKEAASQSGYLGLQFAKYPEKLTKSLLTAKALGMELKDMDAIANSLLDFESSISKEFEAQLLTGKNINLSKARELLMNNKLDEAAIEISKQLGTSKEFLDMNRFAADSWSESLGMSRDQLANILKQQEYLKNLGVSNMQQAYKMVENYKKLGKEQELLSKLKSQDAYNDLVNLSTQDRLMNTIENIKQSIADFIQNSPIFDKIKGFIEYISKPSNLQATLIKIRNIMADVTEVVGTLITGTATLMNRLGVVSDVALRKIQNFSNKLPSSIRSFGGDLNFKTEIAPKEEAEVTTETQAAPKKKMANTGMTTQSVKDAVIFPKNNLIIKKDPLDYTVFVKNPENLVPKTQNVNESQNNEYLKSIASDIKSMVAEATRGTRGEVKQEILFKLDSEVLSKYSLKAQSRSYFPTVDVQTPPFNDQM